MVSVAGVNFCQVARSGNRNPERKIILKQSQNFYQHLFHSFFSFSLSLSLSLAFAATLKNEKVCYSRHKEMYNCTRRPLFGAQLRESSQKLGGKRTPKETFGRFSD